MSTVLQEKVWLGVIQIFNCIKDTEIVRLIVVFGPISAFVHWFATQLYTSYCVKAGFWGVIHSFINILTPQCIVISTIMNYSFFYYSQVWKYMLGALVMFCSSVLKKIILK